MESLRENKLLMYAILTSACLVAFLALGISPELTHTFEIVDFPDDVSILYKVDIYQAGRQKLVTTSGLCLDSWNISFAWLFHFIGTVFLS